MLGYEDSQTAPARSSGKGRSEARYSVGKLKKNEGKCTVLSSRGKRLSSYYNIHVECRYLHRDGSKRKT